MPLRLNAAASLTWGEVNLESREVRLSAGDGRKVQGQQRLPLPSLAVDMLREIEPAASLPDGLVFPSASPRNRGGRYSGWSQTVSRLRARSGVPNWTPHDFRRAAVSLVAELRPDIDETALDRWLTHKASSTNSGVKAVYQRAQGFTKMRAAADAWDEILRGALEAAGSDDSNEAA
jgi:integrase